MSEPKPPTENTTPPRKPGATWHGFVPDDHPIYQGGWNFLAGKNLKPTDDEPPESAVYESQCRIEAREREP